MNSGAMIRTTFSGMALLIMAGCSPAPVDAISVKQQVQRHAREIVASYNAHDAARTASFDAPDYIGMFHGTPNVQGPAADEAGMKIQMQDSAAAWTQGKDRITVSRDGTIAIYEAPYTFTFTEAESKKLIKDTGNWIAIFKRQPDGSMKLWRSIGTDAPVQSNK